MSGQPPQKPYEPFVAGRARGRGRGLYQHPKPFDPDHPGQKREPWSLTQGGPRPPPPIPGRSFMAAGRGTPISDPTPDVTSTADSVGRGVKLSGPSSGSDKREKKYPEGRPDALRGRIRDEQKLPERLLYTRPDKIESKVGTTGQPITCEANYFRLMKKPEWQLFAYRVDFQPEVESRGFRNYLIASQKDMIGGYLFDGTQLFCARRLDDDVIERPITGQNGETVLVTFKYTRTVSMTETQSLQILNLILRRSMDGLKMQLIGRNFFDPDAKTKLPQLKLELWPGYVTSIRQHEEDILLCSEISHKVMRMETVFDIMNNIRREERDFTARCTEKILGMTVLTEYNNKTYRIDDIKFDMKPADKFSKKDGSEISFIEYYQTRYGLTIKNATQPLLVSNPKDKDIRGGQSGPVLLVPELCRCTGLTDDMRADFRLMKQMAEHTKIGPKKRIEQLLAFNNRLQQCPASASVLREWNLQLDAELVKIPARILPYPNLLFGNDRKVLTDKKADWTPAFRSNSLFSCIELKRWFLITTPNARSQSQMFIEALQKAGNGMKFMIGSPKFKEIPDDRQLAISKALQECADCNPQMIMCVVSNNNADRYAVIKKRCCAEFGLPSQVMVLRTITPKDKSKGVGGLLSVATKVAIQMNAKLGGLPWMIEMPLSGLMTIGYDVCHDPKDKSKSWGAMVATMDLKKKNTDFFSAVNRHKSSEELSNYLVANVARALTQFAEINGALPERIMFFRDGVGDGQMDYVASHEVAAIKAKINEIYIAQGGKLDDNNEVQFIFIVVSKRVNTRIFFNRQNPDAGTCVDDIITLPERYDFYLVSQSIREGTVSPTGFNVLSDTFGVPPDRVQILAYRFCCFYFNWSGTVRVPALCQYAHKLAFLASQSIQMNPHEALQRKLYYL